MKVQWTVFIAAVVLLIGACGGMEPVGPEDSPAAPEGAKIGKTQQASTVDEDKGGPSPRGFYSYCGYIPRVISDFDCSGMTESEMLAECIDRWGPPSYWCTLWYPGCTEMVLTSATCRAPDPPPNGPRAIDCRAYCYNWVY